MRSYAREVAFCKIYNYIMTFEHSDGYELFDVSKLTDEDKVFSETLVNGVIEHRDELQSAVAELSRSFKLARVYKPDLAAIMLALYELKYTDTPRAVAINEAVGIAKKYSTEKSVSYVNGILAAYVRGLK